MDEKVVVSIYYTYGKQSGKELGERFIINNNAEERAEIFDVFGYEDTSDSKEDFINKTTDVFFFDKHGGDWDEPTGGYITVALKDDQINLVEITARNEIEEIERLHNQAITEGFSIKL